MRHHSPRWKAVPACAAIALLTALVSGCGGGGGGGGSPGPSPTVADVKGFWSGAVGAAIGKVVSLGDGTVWVVEEVDSTPVAVTKATWSVAGGNYSATGQRLAVTGAPGTAVTLAASSVTPGTSMTGTFNTATFSWTYASAGEGTLTGVSLQGAWSGKQGLAVLTWNVSATGKITGSSTTGCVYDGALTDRTDGLKVVGLTVSENCAGTVKNLTGIGTADSTLKLASFPYQVDGGGAGVFRLTKQ